MPGQLISFYAKDHLQLELFLIGTSHTPLQDLVTVDISPLLRHWTPSRSNIPPGASKRCHPGRRPCYPLGEPLSLVMWSYGLMTPQFANSCRSDASHMLGMIGQIKGCGPLWTNAHLEAFVRNNFEYAYNLLSSHAFSGVLGCFYSHGHTFQSVLSKYLPQHRIRPFQFLSGVLPQFVVFTMLTSISTRLTWR